MQVTLLSGQYIEDLSPLRPSHDPRPVPTFWAKSIREAFAHAFDSCVPRPYRRVKFEFGWGEAGAVVYEPIGAIEHVGINHSQTTWTVYLWDYPLGLPKRLIPVLIFVTDSTDKKTAIENTIAALNL